jgi:hypothetical protein
MAALTPRQELAQQLAAFIWKRGGSVTNQFPLKESEHIRFEARMCDESLTRLRLRPTRRGSARID